MPMAQPFWNWIGREIVRGRGSLMPVLLEARDARSIGVPRFPAQCHNCLLLRARSRRSERETASNYVSLFRGEKRIFEREFARSCADLDARVGRRAQVILLHDPTAGEDAIDDARRCARGSERCDRSSVRIGFLRSVG